MISMHGPPNARVAKCASPRKVRGPTQSARTHAKCAGPRKVRGPTQSSWAALWVRGTPSARTRAKCVGRGSIARAALNERAAIAWRGEWAALPTHLPRTCHSMPTQCNRGSTRVGRDEAQSPGTLRVKKHSVAHTTARIDYTWQESPQQCLSDFLSGDISFPPEITGDGFTNMV